MGQTVRDQMITKGLSNREAEVAEAVSTGLSNKDTGAKLFVTEKTVKFHLTNIYKKLGLKSRAQLIVMIAADRPCKVEPEQAAAPDSGCLPKGATPEAA